jgi:membrane protease YdiL (CAAX protease family)
VSGQKDAGIPLEIAVVLAFVWLPALVLGMFPISIASSWTFYQFGVVAGVQQLSWIVVLLYIVYLSGDSWSLFGIVRPRIFYDSISGVLILFSTMIFLYATYALATSVIDARSLEQLFTPSDAVPGRAPGDTFILVVAVIVVGISEELVFRSYLITRLEALFGSAWKSVIGSSLIFGSAHLYQGPGGCLNACLIGLSFGFFFCVTRRIWPLAVAHALMNLVALWPRL